MTKLNVVKRFDIQRHISIYEFKSAFFVVAMTFFLKTQPAVPILATYVQSCFLKVDSLTVEKAYRYECGRSAYSNIGLYLTKVRFKTI